MSNSVVRAVQKFLLLELHTTMCRLYEVDQKKLHEIVTPTVDVQGNPVQGFPLDCPPLDDKKNEALGSGDLNAAYAENHIRHYFSMVDSELTKVVATKELPVVVIGLTKSISSFRELTKNGAAIIGYKDASYHKVEDLLVAALAVVKEYEVGLVNAALKKFFEAEGSNVQAFGARHVWLMAHEGRIETLFVEEGLQVPGKLDPENKDHLLIGMGTQNVIDVIIERTRATRGHVVIVKPGTLKEFEHIGAILRY